jgi:hypothetical protein
LMLKLLVRSPFLKVSVIFCRRADSKILQVKL